MNNYLREGDLVTLNKDLPNKPVMMVFEIKKETMDEGSGPFKQLIGIKCIWFTKDMHVEKEVFNFKDLIALDQENNVYD